MRDKDELFMALALRLKAELGKDVCLAVPNGADEDNPGKYYSSVDLDGPFVGHTALFNLIQHLDCKDAGLLKKASFFLTCAPKASDVGIFIMRCNLGASASMLFFPEGDKIIKCQPSSTVLDNPRGNLNVKEDKVVATLDWKEKRKTLAIDAKNVPSDQRKTPSPLLDLSVLFLKLDFNFAQIRGKTIQTRVAPPIDQYSAKVILKQAAVLDYSALDADGKRLFDSIFMLTAYALPICASKTDKSQSIGVILVKPDGKILSWGTDLSNTFHGEVTTVRRWQDAETESTCKKARLYTSLEPCNMCAGLLAMYDSHCELEVLYGQQDTGVSGANRNPTALKAGSVNIRELPLLELKYKGEKPFYEKLNEKTNEFKVNLATLRKINDLLKATKNALNNLPKGGFINDDPAKIKAAVEALEKAYVGTAKQFDASATGGLTYQSTRRRLAKAAMQLASLVEEIGVYGQKKADDAGRLLVLWEAAQGLLSTAAADDYRKVMKQYIDGTKSKNVVKIALQDPASVLGQPLQTTPDYAPQGPIKNVLLTLLDTYCIPVQAKVKKTREDIISFSFAL